MAADPSLSAITAILREAHFSAIVENSVDAIVSKTLDGTVLSWNRAAERIFGWRADEIIGRSIRLLIPDDRQSEEDHILARIGAGEIIPKFETVRLRRDGTPIPVATAVSPILDAAGQIVGASKIANDISETVAMRARLEESERLFRTMANTISQLAWITAPDGQVIWFNDRWYEFTGTSPEIMRDHGWRTVYHPAHTGRVKAGFQHCLETGEPWEDTFPIRGKDGEYRWFLTRANTVRADDGRIQRWFGTNTDITQQREQEQRIRLLMGEVNHRAKNMLAVVQALVSRTADKSFAESLGKRLQALATNQDMLAQRNWFGAPAGQLIRSQLAAASDLIGTRVRLTGPDDIMLSPSAAETLGLAIHELTTNATKYGALSGKTGELAISWDVEDVDGAPHFVVQWRETGGPLAKTPNRKGFGTVMIDHNPRLSLDARVSFGYPPEGFFWTMAAPLERVQPSD